MADYDDLKLATEAMTGGKNTIVLDDRGMPSFMVRIPMMKCKDLIEGGSDKPHPAFKVGLVEKKEMLVSKFINVVINDRAYSLPLKDPRTSVNFDMAVTYCRNKGKGWGLMPYSLWCAIALWSKKNDTMPHGNNNWGCDISSPHEHGVATSYETAEGDHKGQPAHTATGSGPDTWNHNWLPDGIADMNGNVWEWTAGMRLKNGEIQLIADSDTMIAETSMADASTAWKAIDKDGNLIAPTGKDGTLKWDWVESTKLQLTDKTVTFKMDEGHGHSYKDMTLVSGLTAAPELAKVMLLYPDDPGKDVYGGDYHLANVTGERLPICGGSWHYIGSAGVFHVNLHDLRAYADGGIGFRSAYCEL